CYKHQKVDSYCACRRRRRHVSDTGSLIVRLTKVESYSLIFYGNLHTNPVAATRIYAVTYHFTFAPVDTVRPLGQFSAYLFLRRFNGVLHVRVNCVSTIAFIELAQLPTA